MPSVKETHYEPLSSTSYGEPDGLFGINCRHKKYPFIDGVNFQRYFPYDKEENDKRYKEIQEQRRLERKVRNTKREADMLNEIGDTEGAKAARAKLKEQRKAYRTYCDEHELTQRSDRLTVSKGSVSAAKTQKPLDNGGGSGIIEKRQLAQAKEFNAKDYNIVEDLPIVENLKKYAADKMGIQYMSGIEDLKNGTNAQTILSTVQELSETYNKHFSRISFIDFGNEKTIAETLGNELRLNLVFMNRPDALEAVLNEWVKTGYIPKGCNNCEYVARHEFFHLISQDLISMDKSKIKTEISRQRIPAVSINAQKNAYEYVADLLSAVNITKQHQKLKNIILKLICKG